MDNPVTRISVRNLVEFILQSGDLDNRRGTIDKDAMLKGSRLHRKLQKQMGGDYRAEVALRMNYSYEDLDIRVEGRADEFLQKMRLSGSMRLREYMEMWNRWKSL